MSGTKAGAAIATERRRKTDPGFYARIGAIGGAKSKRHLTHEEATLLGHIGGSAPKRKRTTKPHKHES